MNFYNFSNKTKAHLCLTAFLFFVCSAVYAVESEQGENGLKNSVQGELALEKRDCIIVLGLATEGTKPSPLFEERIRHGVILYQQGLANHLIFSGGLSNALRPSESRMAAELAMTLGVPQENILLEEESTSTLENIKQSKALMNEYEFQSAILVTHAYHMNRAMQMAKDSGIDVSASPVPKTNRIPFLEEMVLDFKETIFLSYYHLSTLFQ